MNSLIKRIVTGLISGTIFFATFLFLPPVYFSWIVRLIVLYILAIELPALTKKRWELILLGLLYIIVPASMIITMNEGSDFARTMLLTTFLAVFSFDIGAYIFGSLFGKEKIWPKISPKKTWEGFLGGWLTVMLVMFITLFLQGINAYSKNPFMFFIKVQNFSLIIATLATIGDFFESWLKRRSDLKDSGSSLPGHGGFLDRFDSLAPTIYFIYFYIHFVH